MDVQIFGAVSSPSICAYTLHYAAKNCGAESAAVLQQIVDHFYADNWLTSFRTVKEAEDAAEIMYRVLKGHSFELAQWGSSSREVLKSLPGTGYDTRPGFGKFARGKDARLSLGFQSGRFPDQD